MEKLHAFFAYSLLGLPIGFWTALIVAGVLNEVILKSKWTEAKSIWQGFWRVILWVPAVGPLLARFPWVGPLLQKFAGIEEQGLPLPPPNPPSAVLLPLAFLAALSACGTVGGQAFTRCELGALPQTSQAIIACSVGALTSPADWQAQLTACGVSVAAQQLNCVVAAIVAATGGDKLAPGMQRSIVYERGQIWLNAHGGAPRACLESTRL